MYLNDNGQMPKLPPPAGQLGKQGVPTVAEVVQEHIDLPVRPSRGTIGTYQRILDLRIRNMTGLHDGGISLFALSRRLGHASVRTTEQVYGHLMPQALQDGADATERPIRGLTL